MPAPNEPYVDIEYKVMHKANGNMSLLQKNIWNKCKVVRTQIALQNDEIRIFCIQRRRLEEYKSIFKVEMSATEWACERLREASDKVAKNEAGRLNIVQRIMLKSTDFLRRINAPAGGQGGVSLSYLCPKCNSFPLKDYMWWVSAGKKHCSWWCAICGGKYEWRAPNR